MDAFRYLGLRTSPFEGRPDPAFFYEAGGQDEALAAVRYAVHATKSCAAVIGESGLGKTLIARLLAERVNRKTNVLWLNGVGQPKAHTELSVYEAGALVGIGRFNGRPVESLLSAWTRSTQAWAHPTLLIVDNAESLRESAWRDLLSLMTHEFEAGRRVTVALFGLASLRGHLALPRLERIRRRLFRLVELRPFTDLETAGYIAHRLRVAGRESPLFTEAAVRSVFEATGGNPALVNQLCDNALVDAFGEERTTIDEPEIHAALRSIVGTRLRTQQLPHQKREHDAPPRMPAAVQRVVRKAESALDSLDRSALRPLIECVPVALPPPDPTSQLEVLAASLPPLSLIGAAARSTSAPVDTFSSEAAPPAAVAFETPFAAFEAQFEAPDDPVIAAPAAIAEPLPTPAAFVQTRATRFADPLVSSLLGTRISGVTTRIATTLARVRETHVRRSRASDEFPRAEC